MPNSGQSSLSTLTALMPLTVPVANPAFKPIRRERGSRPSISSVALIPLFYAALLFLAGIVLAHFLPVRPSLLFVSLLPMAGIAILAILKAPRLTWLPIALIWMMLGAWSAETDAVPTADPIVLGLSDGLLRTVEGVVTDAGPIRSLEQSDNEDSEAADSSEDAEARSARLAQRIDLQLNTAEVVTDTSDGLIGLPRTDTAKLRLTVIWPSNPQTIAVLKPIACGQSIRAVIRFLPPDAYRDPGVWSRAVYLESHEVTAIGSVVATKRDGATPRLLSLGQPAASVACLINRWRNVASARLQSLPELTRKLPRWLRARPEDAAMFTALLTGDRTYLTRSLRTGFERTGSFHLIVVSGLHLAILAGCVFALARRLHLQRIPTTLLTIAVTLAYALFTGFAIPAQRSFWMVTLYLIGRLLYRNRSPLNVIGFATLCLAAASPRSIFDASFQMTVIAVVAIAGVAIPLLERTLHARLEATRDLKLISLDPKLPPRIAQFRVTLRLLGRHFEPLIGSQLAWRAMPILIRTVLRLGELIFVTLIVELALALPMAMYFHRITEYALPVNLCVLPLLGILLPSAMLMLLVLVVWPTAAVVPAAICLFLLHFCVLVVRWLGALQFGDLRIPDRAEWQIAAALILFLLAVLLARSSFSRRSSAWQLRLAFAAIVLMAVATLWPRHIEHPQNALLFEAIDVGQGDSLLLITPDGKTLLIDGGGIGFQPFGKQAANPSEFDIGEEVVSAALWSRGIRHLDAVALTHAHHDHMGGLPAILRNFRPRELWVGKNPDIPAYTALLREAQSLNIAVRSLHTGDRVVFGQADFHVLAPAAAYQPGAQPANNDSLVMQARFGATSILLEGDAEAPEEHAILAMSYRADLRSSVLKVGHHGSISSTRPEFLAQVGPQWAVISCGRRNRFGHPRQEILSELEDAHAHILRTDRDGAVCLVLDGKSVTMQPACQQGGNEGQ